MEETPIKIVVVDEDYTVEDKRSKGSWFEQIKFDKRMKRNWMRCREDACLECEALREKGKNESSKTGISKYRTRESLLPDYCLCSEVATRGRLPDVILLGLDETKHSIRITPP